ncbi:formate dehydrogenase accessory protein FdhE [Mesorhizobium sp. KR1-2]|uniref:formate dehydrogenase accessory protein FdhE n=1 Tax=Mesorhizobium sp. KR1-2 TaxID=3156609 RepID=UPI0032B31D2F
MAGKPELTPDPTAIGEVSSPPFVRLPDPGSLFARRAARLRTLASVSPLEPYLSFVADLSEAQQQVATQLGSAPTADGQEIARAREFGMPLIDREKSTSDEGLAIIFDRLFAEAEMIDKPPNAAAALSAVAHASALNRRDMVSAIFSGLLPPDAIAEHIYIWAALQVHFSRLASSLDPKTIKPVADGICPACGSLPSISMVVDWTGAHGARFCVCSLCSTMWHYVRIKCVCCGSTEGVGYKEVEDGGGAVKAETCDKCQSWLKIIYQKNSPNADPVADDVASLGMDMLMRAEPYRRGGFAPLLAGF